MRNFQTNVNKNSSFLTFFIYMITITVGGQIIIYTPFLLVA